MTDLSDPFDMVDHDDELADEWALPALACPIDDQTECEACQ